MFKKLYPYEYAESVFTIDYEKLYEKGFRGILFDLDNTLVPHGEPSTPEVDELFKRIQKIGFKTFILSDNGVKRIEAFLKNIEQCPYIDNANKPKPDNYLRAIELMGLQKNEVVFIGDQTFKDILGANNANIASILVKYIGYYTEKKIGIKRHLERIVLKFYNRSKKYKNRIGNIEIKEGSKMSNKKLLSERSDFLFKLAVRKGIIQRDIKDLFSREKFAHKKSSDKLPITISEYNSYLIKKGTEPELQENKVVNIEIASSKINGLIIHPGESFSYWKTIGTVNKRKGYKEGRVIINNKVKPGMGGGLCNLANTINLLILNSPLEITEFHTHSDALAPDYGERIPLKDGTCVGYNYIDYRFKNTTDSDFQLNLWVKDKYLYGELKCVRDFPWEYKITEEDHHFQKEGDKLYRVSKIYQNKYDKKSGELHEKKSMREKY